MTNPTPHLFWITSRAAGTTAMMLSSITVSFGLLMGGKLIKRLGPDRRNIHEILSLSVIVAIAVHGLALVGDKFLHPNLVDVTVPFASSYKTFATSLGIVAGWGTIFLGLSYYLRKRIGIERWKVIHRFTLLVWVAALIHTFSEGTDAGQVWFTVLMAVTAAPAVVLLVVRLGTRQSGAARPPGRPATATRPSL